MPKLKFLNNILADVVKLSLVRVVFIEIQYSLKLFLVVNDTIEVSLKALLALGALQKGTNMLKFFLIHGGPLVFNILLMHESVLKPVKILNWMNRFLQSLSLNALRLLVYIDVVILG